MECMGARACLCVRVVFFRASTENVRGSSQSSGHKPEKRAARLIRCRDRDSPACAKLPRSAGMHFCRKACATAIGLLARMHLAASIQPPLMPRPRLQLVPEATGDDRCANAFTSAENAVKHPMGQKDKAAITSAESAVNHPM